jgi:LysM repeat protein
MTRDGTLAIAVGLVVVLGLVGLGAWHLATRETSVARQPETEAWPAFDLYDVGRGFTRIHLTATLGGDRGDEPYEMKITGKDRMISAEVGQASRPTTVSVLLRRDWIEALNAATREAIAAESKTESGINVSVRWEPWVKDHRLRKVVAFHVDPQSGAGKALLRIVGDYDLPTYKVVKGDTLSGIALKKLGNASRWREIIALNPGLTERNLRVGQTIRLPRQ